MMVPLIVMTSWPVFNTTPMLICWVSFMISNIEAGRSPGLRERIEMSMRQLMILVFCVIAGGDSFQSLAPHHNPYSCGDNSGMTVDQISTSGNFTAWEMWKLSKGNSYHLNPRVVAIKSQFLGELFDSIL